jgi:predicted RND superfamily exporter protein
VNIGQRVALASIRNRRKIYVAAAIIPMVVIALAVIPTFFNVPVLNPIRVDVDPENMLSPDEPVRQAHQRLLKQFGLGEIVAVGIINDKHPNGVFNVTSLTRAYELAEYAKTLTWQKDGKQVGVIEVDIFAPSTVDNIEQGAEGVVKFEYLMPEPPKTEEAALAIRDKMARMPFFRGTLISEDNKALALYIPLTDKKLSRQVYEKLLEKIATFKGDEKIYMGGLPVVQDVFAMEIWTQLGMAGPGSMFLIMGLMWMFFRRMRLIMMPIIIANIAVIVGQGMLVICGFDIHLMSSEIPIFVMTIAVLDSIHILSEFHDKYQEVRNTEKAIVDVMKGLFVPLFYVFITTVVGFAAEALTPLPPLRVFGLFVAFGVTVGWVLTVTLLPAYLSSLDPSVLDSLGSKATAEEIASRSIVGRLMRATGKFAYRFAKPIVVVALLVSVATGFGIPKLEMNDNPANWFAKSHPLAIADREMNKHFSGVYMAYLELKATNADYTPEGFAAQFGKLLQARGAELAAGDPKATEVFASVASMAKEVALQHKTPAAALGALVEAVRKKREVDPGTEAWAQALDFVDAAQQQEHVFKRPDVLRWVEGLQKELEATNRVGKTTSVVELVKVVHRELRLGKAEEYRIPDTREAVAQTMITFLGSHRPNDFWHYVTPDYQSASVWVQVKTGDNQDMQKVVAAVDKYMATTKPPVALTPQWFGLTYINIVWQDKIVGGMARAFACSYIACLVLVMLLFRSVRWGLLCMLPLSVTIVALYGGLGLMGLRYDAPTAVLSALSLGLAIDFSIHFLARSRDFQLNHSRWEDVSREVFGEPARALLRNVVVLAAGFLPLVIPPIIPYKVTGLLMATIMLLSGVTTLVILPAAMRVLEKPLFAVRQDRPATYRVPVAAALGTAALIVLTTDEFVNVSIGFLAGVGVASVIALTFFYRWLLRVMYGKL